MDTLSLAEVQGDVRGCNGGYITVTSGVSFKSICSSRAWAVVQEQGTLRSAKANSLRERRCCLSLEYTSLREGVARLGVLRAATSEEESRSSFLPFFLELRACALLLLLLVSRWSSVLRVFF